MNVRSYFGGFVFALSVTIVVCMAIAGYRYFGQQEIHKDRRLGALLRYQQDKIDSGICDADTVFLGDSSLGNAINVQLFSEITGMRALSLALTGTFRYAGAFVLLNRLLQRCQRLPRNVVLILAPDAIAGGFSPDSYFLASPMPVVKGLSYKQNFLLLKNYIKHLLDIRVVLAFLTSIKSSSYDAEIESSLRQYDYVLSFAQIDLKDNGFRLAEKVVPDPFLTLIAHLCVDNGVNCLYGHGPIVQFALDLTENSNDSYFSAARDLLSEVGFILATPGPIIIPNDQRGDSFFHVHPQYRSAFTRLYADRLSPFIATGTGGLAND